MKKLLSVLLALLLMLSLSVGLAAEETVSDGATAPASSDGVESDGAEEEGFTLPAKYGDRWLTWKERRNYIMYLGGMEGTFYAGMNVYYDCPLDVNENAANTATIWLLSYIPENFPDFDFHADEALWPTIKRVEAYIATLTDEQKADEKVAAKLEYFAFLREKAAWITNEAHENDVCIDGYELMHSVVEDFQKSIELAVAHIGSDEEYEDPTAWDTIDFGEPPEEEGEKELEEEEEDESLMTGIPHILIVPNTEKVLRETDYPENGVTVLTAELAQNEVEGMQFLVHFKKDIHNLKVTVSDITNSNGDKLAYTLYRQYYHNMDSVLIATKEVLGMGWYPDALVPMLEADGDLKANNVCDVYRHNNQGYWIDVEATEDQPAGIYTGTVTVSCDEHEDITIPVSVEVWNFSIPTRPSSMTQYISQSGVCGTGWDTTLKYRISNYNAPIYRSNYSTFEDYIQAIIDWYNNDERISCIWAVDLDVSGAWVDVFSGEGAKIAHDMFEEAGLLDKVYFFCHDEGSGSEEKLNEFVEIKNVLRDFWPSCNTFWTSCDIDDPRFTENVGTYCPLWGKYDLETMETICRKARAEGHTFWTYTCVGPTSPASTYHINDYLMSPRMLRWMMMDCGIQGDQYWGIDVTLRYGENDDYWDNICTMSSVAGDGFLLYPGSVGDGRVERDMAVPSLRITSARDGLEDYEYLTLLETKLNALIEKYGLNTTADALLDTYYDPMYLEYDNYNLDPQALLVMRRVMAADIMSDDDTFVAVAPAEDGSLNRIITVCAPTGTAVSVEGVSLIEGKRDGYSVYTASVNVPDVEKTVTVKVGDNEVTRVLGSFDYTLEDSGAETVVTALEPAVVEEISEPVDLTVVLYIAASAVIVASVCVIVITLIKRKK